MKNCLLFLFLALLLTGQARAADFTGELLDALPEEAEDVFETVDLSAADALFHGLQNIAKKLSEDIEKIVRQRMRGAAAILLVVILCGAVEGFSYGAGLKTGPLLPMVGALSVTLLAAGSLDSLIGLGAETIRDLSRFSNVLLPALAAATAAAGAVSSAAIHQITTVFFVDLVLNLIDRLLVPLVYLYIGALTAACCMPESRLEAIAEGLKKVLTWLLTTVLLFFTVYLSVVRVITGAVDGAAVKVAKAAISGVVPVVGSIIADASETVLAGAGLLKNTIGVVGMLGILAACAYPFMQLGVQYLIYKLTALLAGMAGTSNLCKLINGLGGAFGLILGMSGACALLLLVSVLSSVAAVAV